MRKLTSNEIFYSILEKVNSPFLIQFILEGKGLISKLEVEEALLELSISHQILRVSKHGKQWVPSNKNYSVFEYEERPLPTVEDGFYQKPLETSLIEFHLFQSTSDTSLVLRYSHSLMDGKSGGILLDLLFSTIKNKSLFEEDDFLSEKSFVFKKLDKHLSHSLHLFPPRRADTRNVKVNRKFARQTISQNLKFSRVATITSIFAKSLKKTIKVLIPVDLRTDEQKSAMGNYCLPLFLRCDESDETIDLQKKILLSVKRNDHLKSYLVQEIIKFLPFFMIKLILKSVLKINRLLNLVSFNAIISDLGVIDVSKLSTPRFKATSVYSLPITANFLDLIVNVLQQNEQVEVGAWGNFSDINITPEYFILEKSIIERSAFEITNKDLYENLKMFWKKSLLSNDESFLVEGSYYSQGGESLNYLLMIDEICNELNIENKTSALEILLSIADQSFNSFYTEVSKLHQGNKL